MHACMYVRLYVYMYVCMYACMHVFMYLCMYAMELVKFMHMNSTAMYA